VGLQLMAGHLQEEILFRAAYNLERGLGLERKWPSLN